VTLGLIPVGDDRGKLEDDSQVVVDDTMLLEFRGSLRGLDSPRGGCFIGAGQVNWQGEESVK